MFSALKYFKSKSKFLILSLKIDTTKILIQHKKKKGKEYIYLNIFEAGWAKNTKLSCYGSVLGAPCEMALRDVAEGWWHGVVVVVVVVWKCVVVVVVWKCMAWGGDLGQKR
jgi:hypothetical protein